MTRHDPDGRARGMKFTGAPGHPMRDASPDGRPAPHCQHDPVCLGCCMIVSASDEFLADALSTLEKTSPLPGSLAEHSAGILRNEIARRKKVAP
jgi:hypothetical protein